MKKLRYLALVTAILYLILTVFPSCNRSSGVALGQYDYVLIEYVD